MSVLASVGVVFGLVLIEAFFVAAEIALVSLRESQVRELAKQGRRGRRLARLVADPNRFLATVQLGVTLTALMSSAFGAVTLTDDAAGAMEDRGVDHDLAHVIAFLGVTLIITYVTLVVGELAPKRLGLQRAERFALMIAPTLDLIARLTRGVIWLLSVSTNGLVRLLGGDPKASREAITDEELRGLVAAHESLGLDERKLIDEVFGARECSLREIMTPRTEVTFLDAAMTVARAVAEIHDSPWSRYPVVRGSADDVVGFVHVRDLLLPGREAMRLGELVREVTMLPASLNVLAALSQLRREGQHLAIVVDEYGGTAGIVTMEDLIEEVVGEIRDEYDPDTHQALRLHGGDIVTNGLLNQDQFEEATGVRLPEGPYETAAGYVVASLGHLPALGESVEYAGVRLTVTRLDGRRVDRLRVTRLAPPDQDADSPLSGPVEREPAEREAVEPATGSVGRTGNPAPC
ncbi:MAG: hemolysin family protein [Frankiaceae bacterium]